MCLCLAHMEVSNDIGVSAADLDMSCLPHAIGVDSLSHVKSALNRKKKKSLIKRVL